MSSKGNDTDAEDQNKEFEQQVNTYIAWVNSQLKKRPGTQPVTDLKTDFSDGVVLATLVEIISSEKLEGIENPATAIEEKQHNINSVLRFLNGKNIRMHHIEDSDVIDGNVKSIMRLILTLAAHFKPSSVGTRKSVSAAAANATVALGDIHKRVTASGGYKPRWKSSTPRYMMHSSPSSSRSTSSRSEQLQIGSPTDENTFTLNRLPSSGEVFASPSLPERSKAKRLDGSFSSTPIRNLSSINSEVIIGSGTSFALSEQVTEHYDDLESELSSTRDLISALQNLLLNGEIPDQNEAGSDQKCRALGASSPEEESLILQSQLDLCQHENSRLKMELADTRQECRTTSANQSALHNRTQQQDREMLSLKQELLKLNLVNENLKKDKEYLSAQVEDYKREKQALSNNLSEKNMMIKHLNDEIVLMSTQLKKIGNESKHKLNSVQHLEMQVQELSRQLRALQRYKHSSSAKSSGNEMTVISDSLRSLRLNLPPHDSRQHIVDTLEQAILSLTEQKQRTEPAGYRRNEYSRQPVTHSPRNRKKGPPATQKTPSTTVIYFTERNVTPVRATIPKRIGTITLYDFKSILHTSDKYKYNFKALDPEFGTVKREIFHDDDLVPGWEGKIVAWLEKEVVVDEKHV